MKDVLLSLLLSLLLTLFFESVFYAFYPGRSRRDYLLLLLVNVVTNPTVVLIHQVLRFTGHDSVFLTFTLEAAAVAVEWLFYRRYAEKINRPLLFSLGANVFSFGIGWLLQHLFIRILGYLR